MRICCYCGSEIADEAVKCRFCQEYQSGIECDACCASLPAKAHVCRFCGADVASATRDSDQTIPRLSLQGEVFPSVLFRFRLLPQEVSTDQEKIVITTPGLFRLWQNSDEIQWAKVAGFSYRSGIFWDRIDIETRGQKPSSILGTAQTPG